MFPAVDLTQPDQVSCGPTAVVAHRLLVNKTLTADREAVIRDISVTHEVLASTRTREGRFQLPWPRALGTSPWSAAKEMEAVTRGSRYGWKRIWPERRAAMWAELHARARVGEHSLLYVGNRWLPRHVVLVIGASPAKLEIFDPATGRQRRITFENFLAARLGVSGWDFPWIVVTRRIGE